MLALAGQMAAAAPAPSATTEILPDGTFKWSYGRFDAEDVEEIFNTPNVRPVTMRSEVDNVFGKEEESEQRIVRIWIDAAQSKLDYRAIDCVLYVSGDAIDETAFEFTAMRSDDDADGHGSYFGTVRLESFYDRQWTENKNVQLRVTACNDHVSLIRATDNSQRVLLKGMLESKDPFDFHFLCADEKKVGIHRAVARTAFEVVRSRIDNKESPSYDLKDYDVEHVSALVRFVYLGPESLKTLSKPNMLGAYILADMLRLEEAVKRTQRHISEWIRSGDIEFSVARDRVCRYPDAKILGTAYACAVKSRPEKYQALMEEKMRALQNELALARAPLSSSSSAAAPTPSAKKRSLEPEAETALGQRRPEKRLKQ